VGEGSSKLIDGRLYTLYEAFFRNFFFSLRGCFSRPATTISTIFPWFGFEGCIFDPLLLLSSLLIIFFFLHFSFIHCWYILADTSRSAILHSAYFSFLFTISVFDVNLDVIFKEERKIR